MKEFIKGINQDNIKWETLEDLQPYFKENNIEVHPSVILGDYVYLGKGVKVGQDTFISHSCRIDEGTTIGTDVIIKDNVVIGKDCTLDDKVILRNNIIIGDKVVIKSEATINSEARIENKTYIGKNTIIGTKAIISEGDSVHLSVHIKGSVDEVSYVGGNNVSVGCLTHDIDYWEKEQENIVFQEEFTKQQYEEYKLYLIFIRDLIKL